MSYDQGRMDAYGELMDWLTLQWRCKSKHHREWLALWSPLVFWLNRERQRLRLEAGTRSASECVGAVRLLGDLWKEED